MCTVRLLFCYDFSGLGVIWQRYDSWMLEGYRERKSTWRLFEGVQGELYIREFDFIIDLDFCLFPFELIKGLTIGGSV